VPAEFGRLGLHEGAETIQISLIPRDEPMKKLLAFLALRTIPTESMPGAGRWKAVIALQSFT